MESSSNGRGIVHERPKVHLVGVHSYRGGSGKTTLAANMGFLAAREGAKVAILDADLQAPALHIALGVESKRILHSVSEFVKGQCEIEEVPIDLSRDLGVEKRGTLHLLPASTDLQTTTSILFDGYDVARLKEHVMRLACELELDFLILDTHLGINRETLLSLAISNTIVVLLRPDALDHQGAPLLVQIAKKVGVPSCLLVPNMVSESSDRGVLTTKLEEDFGAPVAGILPWCTELFELGWDGPFAARYQEHPFTAELERITERLMPAKVGAGVDSGGES